MSKWHPERSSGIHASKSWVTAITSYKDLAMHKRYTHLKVENLTKKLG